MKKIIKNKVIMFSGVFMIVVIALVLNFFILEHKVNIELIDEISYDSSYSYAFGEKYFFIKDKDYLNFYDGQTLLEYYSLEYDLSKLNTKEYTYLVAVNGKIDSVTYSGKNCNLRTYFGIPDEYIATIDYEMTKDGMIRIYKLKKMNIDYDYHS